MNSMCKIILAASVFGAGVTDAALIYDRQGTKLTLGGQVKTVITHAGSNTPNRADDGTISDIGRIRLSGRTGLADHIDAFSSFEWQAGHSGTSREDVRLKARQAYLGVDFHKYGLIQFGRYVDPFSYASNAVSVMDDFSPYAGNNERNSGHLSYKWSRSGFDFGLSYQFAVDRYNCDTLGDHNFRVDSGFSVYAGYTFRKVFDKPFGLRSAYLYLNGQSEQDGGFNYTPFRHNRSLKILVENLRSIDGSLSWGYQRHGLYAAANYNYSKVKYAKLKIRNSVQNWDVESKTQAYEAVLSYSFDNGFRVAGSYHFINIKTDANNLSASKGSTRWMQWLVDYNVTPRFKIWMEGVFDAGSDDRFARIQDEDVLNGRSNAVMLGLRYSF